MADVLRLEKIGPLVLAGLMRHHGRGIDHYALVRQIGLQWNDYMIRRVAPPWTPEAWRYGVVMRIADGDVELPYFCGAPPPEPPEMPPGFTTLVVPALTYAVFAFDGHIFEFETFIQDVFARSLAAAGYDPASDASGTPEFIERYDWRFDPATGKGGFDMLVPVAT
jgi:predicted transcriptional regulator YdeE